MIPIRSIKNQYRGINAHLHSLWQTERNWSGFHTLQIGDLLKALNTQLMHLNYIAEVEQSLQIRRLGSQPTRPKADLLVYDSAPNRPFQQHDSWYGQTQTIALAELLDEHELSEKPYRALVIYELDEQSGKRGEPVAWIELLSPSNKGNSEDADVYRAKRMNIMVSGLVFVEIDYLNRTPPTFSSIPGIYTLIGREPSAFPYPYHVIVIDPRPSVEEGRARVEPFNVDDAIPAVKIPLNGDDVIQFDFSMPYHKTIEESSYTLRYVNYGELPSDFDQYSESDQTRIVNRMLTVLKAAKRGVDLETKAPLPIESPVSLQDGLAQLADFA